MKQNSEITPLPVLSTLTLFTNAKTLLLNYLRVLEWLNKDMPSPSRKKSILTFYNCQMPSYVPAHKVKFIMYSYHCSDIWCPKESKTYTFIPCKYWLQHFTHSTAMDFPDFSLQYWDFFPFEHKSMCCNLSRYHKNCLTLQNPITCYIVLFPSSKVSQCVKHS